MRRNVVTPEIEQEMLQARAEGLTFNEISIRTGFSPSACWNAVQRHGDPTPPLPRLRAVSIAYTVGRHGELTIEAGASGGYIATVGGRHTGKEECSIKGAIRSALQEELKAKRWKREAI